MPRRVTHNGKQTTFVQGPASPRETTPDDVAILERSAKEGKLPNRHFKRWHKAWKAKHGKKET